MITRCALGAGLLSVSAWICLPVGTAAFTMQTLALFLLLPLLGGKAGSLSVLLYLLLGGFGLPVFSGFRSGPGILLGSTGGYLIGFLAAALAYWAVTARFPKAVLPAMVLGQLLCYGVGTAWFSLLYLPDEGILGILIYCVFPYLVPDGIKIWLAWFLCRRIKLPSRA